MPHGEVAQKSDATQLDSACVRAMELQLAGKLDLAEQLYRAILQAEPRHAAANYCIGMLQIQCKRGALSLAHLKAALELQPEVSDYWLGYLEALMLAGQTAEATGTLALGRQHGLAGAAVEDFAHRLEAAKPHAAAAASPNLPKLAAKPAKPARTRRRGDAIFVRKQESALLTMIQRQNFDAALALARSLTERFPERGLGWKALGAFVSSNGNDAEALAAMQTAVRLMPQDAEAHINLGLTLAKLQRFDEAEMLLKRALAIKPGFAAAHYRLGMTYEFQGRFAEAEASLRRGIALRTGYAEGDDERSYSNLLFLVSHNPTVGADALFNEHCRYGELFEEGLKSSWPEHSNSREPNRCLKVGFVSGDLYQHAVASFIEPVLVQLRGHPNLELHAYYNNVREDDVSRRLRGLFKTWRPVSFVADVQLANQILRDGMDVLIDLSGHTGQNRLPVFARKPAPVQASWIGYPGTTGLRAMDYYLAGRHFLPPGEFDAHFTEKLVYLPANVPFQPHPAAPPVNPLPALETGRITFGSFNRLGKINDSTVAMWSELLCALPEAKMLIAGLAPGAENKKLIEQFAAGGIAIERLIFRERCDLKTYLALHHQVDMCLDTTPYTGGTTTIHALWMGIPTLTVAGPTPAARSGAAFLGDAGLFEFIATDVADFVKKGLYWAAHLAELAEVRAGLRARLEKSPIPQAELIGAAFIHALRRMWTRWCDGLPAASFEIAGSDLMSQGNHDRP
jgi:predicted O-linked N-acetylglucosamine transferase (SPINDLY family)